MFSKFKGEKIALYGLSAETRKALTDLGKDYEIVGLLDSFKTDGELYGKRILSLDSAIKADIKLIVIVARPGSCRAIKRVVEKKCRENKIALMDIRGRNLLEEKKPSYCFRDAGEVTKAELESRIRKADVISFDLFDTLVMRQTLSSEDVAEYVNCQLIERGISIVNFCNRRQESEKELSRGNAPTLIEIYQNMLSKLENHSTLGILAEELADLEWSIDFALLIPRTEVCNIFMNTVSRGKQVYIVSDTYYNEDQLVQILDKCGITGYQAVLSSSGYRTGKLQKLYGKLQDMARREFDANVDVFLCGEKNIYGNIKYLHIGDDPVADIECAKRWGMDAYRLYSGAELLEIVGSLGLCAYMDSISDRLKIGMFVARIFNSPFQFETKNRNIKIKNAYDIGYLLCAPVISDFLLWFYSHMEKEKFRNIWFSARDGYLIKKMYAYMTEILHEPDESVYFLTSRIAAIRAGTENEKDIRYVDEMKFSGTLEENLKERFGINADTVASKNIVAGEKGLMKYKNIILENSSKESNNFCKYIEKQPMKKGNIAFFDFVAKGTTQMFLQKLTNKHLKGFYFLQLEAEHAEERSLDICSFYTQSCMENDNNVIFEEYYILETLLTAPHPLVSGFDERGQPVYASETRGSEAIRCFERAQEGILDYFMLYLKLCPRSERHINREIDGKFLKMVHGIKIMDPDFLGLMVEDPFFNRMTKITDVI